MRIIRTSHTPIGAITTTDSPGAVNAMLTGCAEVDAVVQLQTPMATLIPIIMVRLLLSLFQLDNPGAKTLQLHVVLDNPLKL